jgi:mannose-6-phosphate isomerase
MAFSQKTIKPWGWEILFTPPDLPYTGKIIFIKSGQKLSLQYHDQKQETLCLLEGKGILWLETEKNKIVKFPMGPKTGYTINQGQKHRVEAITDCLVVEASMPQTGKTYRVEDDYNRGDEELKKLQNSKTQNKLEIRNNNC